MFAIGEGCAFMRLFTKSRLFNTQNRGMELSSEALKEFVQAIAAKENELPLLEPSVFIRQMFNEKLERLGNGSVTYDAVPGLNDDKDMQEQLVGLSNIAHPDAYRQLIRFVKTEDNKLLREFAFLAAEHNRSVIEQELFAGDVEFVSRHSLPLHYFVKLKMKHAGVKDEINDILEAEMEFGEEDILEDWMIEGQWVFLYIDAQQEEQLKDFMEGLLANLNEDEALVDADYALIAEK